MTPGSAISAGKVRRLAAAIDTMTRGTAFLQGRAAIFGQADASSAARHAMMLANALRELDRFLNVLLNELAAGGGLHGPELRAFRRGCDAARKLSSYPDLLGGKADDHGLLREMSMQKAALRRVFAARRLSVGIAPSGETAPRLPQVDLAEIGAYYADLSTRLVDHAESRRVAGPAQAARPDPA
ncbi:hypothetical protein ASE00_19095 [Sphingomonas sp. Root710]|uniref:hypothetical protein n=1 Tax=Sphingomonas sp. Root710 TaxID=1736594 RepID=UPI0006FD639B|nr:hypothetical protein [Sphingomonas sp. Root710]KRB79815.1 hypothetical protein ASE00_19095 [Sphingomonas sp. Root710]